MTLVLDGSPAVVQGPGRRGWRRLLPHAVGVTALLLFGSWTVVAQHPQLQSGGWGAFLDARPLEDGLTTTRYVLPVGDGERVVLTSIRNDGPLPLTVLGVDETRGPSWIRASFRARGPEDREFGYRTTALARSSVDASSVTLAPGTGADVLVTFAAPPHVSMADGTSSELRDLALTVRFLGLESTRVVPLMHEPLTLVGAATFARLEREGHVQGQ